MTKRNAIAKVRVTGRVQGVAFRAWTKSMAGRNGISGWVRNENDGSVTALLAGSQDAIDLMLEVLHDGPAAAQVRDVQVEYTPEADVPDGFEIRR